MKLDALDHVRALERHGIADAFDLVLLQEARSDAPSAAVEVAHGTLEAIAEIGPHPLLVDVVDNHDHLRHDPAKLARVLTEVAR